ncbi:hypothetical protein OJ253_3712 [Cryptosporidium canis]|uniref:RNA polymerase sigma-70 factor n=1 Tax=Cryptosporidium canis TaxID=195482 RepID=A0A9D5DG22_9CRYT|nr:hypothetical protein OJ253_3712 [Cryptosporidium canis]
MLGKDTITAIEKSEPDQLTDERLFNCLYERYYKKAFDIALFYCGTNESAEDIVQDVFLKAWQFRGKLRLKLDDWQNWYSYLFVTTRNTALKAILKRKSYIARNLRYWQCIPEIVYDDAVVEREYEKIFSEAVDRLSYQQREIFILKYYGFKPRVIARELNVTARTVSNTLQTARRTLNNRINSQLEINEMLVRLVDRM